MARLRQKMSCKQVSGKCRTRHFMCREILKLSNLTQNEQKFTKIPTHRGQIPRGKIVSRGVSRHQKVNKYANPDTPTHNFGKMFSKQGRVQNQLYVSGDQLWHK